MSEIEIKCTNPEAGEPNIRTREAVHMMYVHCTVITLYKRRNILISYSTVYIVLTQPVFYQVGKRINDHGGVAKNDDRSLIII